MHAHGITIREVGKTSSSSLSRDVVALEPVDLTLRAGEFFSLVGPSGCARSTLLNIIAGLLKPSQAQVDVSVEANDPDRAEVLADAENWSRLSPRPVRRRPTCR